MEKGNTALILNPFLDGMKEAGAQVELVYSKKLNIQVSIPELAQVVSCFLPHQVEASRLHTLCTLLMQVPKKIHI